MASAAQAHEALRELEEKAQEIKKAVEAFTEAGKDVSNTDKGVGPREGEAKKRKSSFFLHGACPAARF